MAKEHDAETLMHFRLFAKLLMVLTFLFGGLGGYFFGFTMGQTNAREFLYAGQQAAETRAGNACVETALGNNFDTYMMGSYSPSQAEYADMKACFE